MVASLLQGVDVHIGKCPFLGKGSSSRLLQRGIKAALLCLFNVTGSEKIFTQRSIAQCTQSLLARRSSTHPV